MADFIRITLPARKPGSYRRCDFSGDIIYPYLRFGDLRLSFYRNDDPADKLFDRTAETMCEGGLISPDALLAYRRAVGLTFPEPDSAKEDWLEDIYRTVLRTRREMLGADALESQRAACMDEPLTFDPSTGIDQREKKQALLTAGQTMIFALFDPAFFSLMAADLEQAAAMGKTVFLLTGEPGDSLPPAAPLRERLAHLPDLHFLSADADAEGGVLAGIADDAALQAATEAGEVCLLAYGEEAFFHCRGLKVDAVITASPRGYYTRTMTNLLGRGGDTVIYVPPGLDITDHVPMVDRTRLSYRHLANLAHDFGDGIYALSPDELYRRYPAHFLNRYHSGTDCPEAAEDFPIRVVIPPEEDAPMANYEAYREEAVAAYLNSLDGVRYRAAYFDEGMREVPIPHGCTERQSGILVHSLRIRRAKDSQVMACGGSTLREKFAADPARPDGLVSNFLFFLTGGLISLYNRLRADRPREQADLRSMHMDYMRRREGDRTLETFPLFRKACIALRDNGEFLFFNFRLGGGEMTIGSRTLRWCAGDVDPAQASSPVCIYTPYSTVADGDAPRDSFRRAVGDGRVNLVVVQDRILAIRRGDVILPGIGVVVSLAPDLGLACMAELGLSPDGDGYFDADAVTFSLRLDPPAGISRAVWDSVRWAYGGGMSLILDGQALTDRPDPESWFAEEGWMSPLSRQTQESALHKMVKHPRTAIGAAENGDLLILVFSGRTAMTTGADYGEMCAIARALHPDVRHLMNADGGGSAMLGLVCRGRFLELSFPSTSSASCAGMVRPIQTVLFIAPDCAGDTETQSGGM
ncbi:MAG: phosphodiester glycosidase family protein [Ruminococcaceae bacterium]|nr:phosphodiester glycosidase family protein [Oscillospiraceae bacterium]